MNWNEKEKINRTEELNGKARSAFEGRRIPHREFFSQCFRKEGEKSVQDTRDEPMSASNGSNGRQ
jgi:hypothetical protein